MSHENIPKNTDGTAVLVESTGIPRVAFVTTATVAAAATFSSGILDTTGYTQVQTEILSDKDGTLGITFYADAGGTDIVRSLSIPYVAAEGYQFFSAPIFVNYIKYEFTNTEGTDTTDFYYTTKLNSCALSPQLLRTDAYVSPKMVASLTRSVNHFDLDAARKHIVGQSAFFFFGFNDAVSTTWVDIHPNSGNINWQTSAQSIEVVSTDAADNGTTPGLGVRSVEVHGLSATGEDQDEVILTNGTTAVAGTLTYMRVNKMHSETCGTYGGSHQGDITCQVAGGGALLSKMTGEEGAVDTSVVYGSGEAGNGYWSVPLGKVMYITRLEVIPDVSGNKTVDIALYERENILDVTAPFSPRRVVWQEKSATSTVEHEFKSHIKIKSLTDIWFRAKASGAAAVEVALDFYLVDEDSQGA